MTDLHKEGYTVEAANDGTVVRLAPQDVQRPHRTLDDLLHAYPVDVGRPLPVSARAPL